MRQIREYNTSGEKFICDVTDATKSAMIPARDLARAFAESENWNLDDVLGPEDIAESEEIVPDCTSRCEHCRTIVEAQHLWTVGCFRLCANCAMDDFQRHNIRK